MKTYELTYIISSEITSEEAGVAANEINSFIQIKEGIILRSDNPVAKTLSYPIKKMGSGYFVISEVQLDAEKLIELNEKLEKNTKILRHTIIIKRPHKIRKERRSARKPLFSTVTESVIEPQNTITEETQPVEVQKESKKLGKKVELKEIEKKLDELLGE